MMRSSKNKNSTMHYSKFIEELKESRLTGLTFASGKASSSSYEAVMVNMKGFPQGQSQNVLENMSHLAGVAFFKEIFQKLKTEDIITLHPALCYIIHALSSDKVHTLKGRIDFSGSTDLPHQYSLDLVTEFKLPFTSQLQTLVMLSVVFEFFPPLISGLSAMTRRLRDEGKADHCPQFVSALCGTHTDQGKADKKDSILDYLATKGYRTNRLNYWIEFNSQFPTLKRWRRKQDRQDFFGPKLDEELSATLTRDLLDEKLNTDNADMLRQSMVRSNETGLRDWFNGKVAARFATFYSDHAERGTHSAATTPGHSPAKPLKSAIKRTESTHLLVETTALSVNRDEQPDESSCCCTIC
jgi:hypothetical protein